MRCGARGSAGCLLQHSCGHVVGIVTLATVGYGDIYSVTPWGKLIGSIVVILGIGLFALPTGVLASGFAEVLARTKEEQKKAGIISGMICPHCGRHIGDAACRSEIDGPEEMRAK